MFNRREDVANVRLSWGHLAIRVRGTVELSIEAWLVEIFLDSVYKAVPRGYECEFSVLDEFDDYECVQPVDWDNFAMLLAMAAECELVDRDWDEGFTELSG